MWTLQKSCRTIDAVFFLPTFWMTILTKCYFSWLLGLLKGTHTFGFWNLLIVSNLYKCRCICTIKLTCEHFISKGGCVFEISLKIWSDLVHAGIVINNWNNTISLGLLFIITTILWSGMILKKTKKHFNFLKSYFTSNHLCMF